ncbi:MAG: UDP-N-acetylmuramate dehydrogenase [Betaproteobacteria bacterium]|nr:MAG: UDP-N-acetylmuramate dehydrogenase [Betaproteobacteria bacterium]
MNMADALHFKEPMARHVSWRAGGPADRFFIPRDLDDLAAFLKSMPGKEPLLFVGLGSNLLVRDGGFRGTVILTHSATLRPQLRDGFVYAEAGVASPKVARFAALHELTGAEFLAGIPGTVGGALAMNAGCYGSETWDVVEKVLTLGRGGQIHERGKSEFEIGYRHCRDPKEEWFAAAYFRLQPGDGQASRARIKEFLARRIATQPLQFPNAGSVFRNPPGDHAARLIESCGLKGLQRGGARVSEKHANFIVNPDGAASAADIEWLILEVKKRVLEKTGVELIPEVRIVGERA